MESFPIAPPSSHSLWFFVPIALVLFAAAALLMTMLGSRRARYELSPAGISLRGDLYGRRLIPASDLLGGAARIVDLDREPELSPRWRTLGTGLPGYKAGWFKLSNGEKALVSLTDTHHAVYLPTNRGFVLLLSPAQPDRFLAAVRRAAPAR